MSFWVRFVLTIVSLLLSKTSQVQLAGNLIEKHGAWRDFIESIDVDTSTSNID